MLRALQHCSRLPPEHVISIIHAISRTFDLCNRSHRICGLGTGMKGKSRISPLCSDVTGQFQHLHPRFGVARLNGTGANTVQSWFLLILENCELVAGMKWKRPISQDWITITGQFQRLYPCFWGRPTQRNWCQHYLMLVITCSWEL